MATTKTPFADALIRIAADDSALAKQLPGIEKAVGESVKRVATGIQTAMLAATAAIGAAALGITAVLKTTADAGDEIAKLSQRVGIGAETLSGYKLAADLAGVSLDSFGTAMQIASRNLVDAAQGTGTAKDALAALGITATDASGTLKSAEQIMLEVSDKFQGMEDGAKKTAYAMDIFGRSGAMMIPLLNQGRAAMEAQRKEAELFGVTFNAAQAKAAEEFNDSFTHIGAALRGFGTMLGNYLMPLANQALGLIIAKLTEIAESGLIRIWAVQTTEAIVRGFVWAAEAVATVAEAAPMVVDAFRGIMAALEALNHIVTGVFGGILDNIGAVLKGAAWLAEKLGLSIAQPLREWQQKTEDWRNTFQIASQQAAESAAGWWEAVGSNNQQATEFAAKVRGMSDAVKQWAGDAVAASVKASAGIGAAATAVAGTPAPSAAARETLTYEVDGQTRTMEIPKTPVTLGAMVPSPTQATAQALAPAAGAPKAASATASGGADTFAADYGRAWQDAKATAIGALEEIQAKAKDAHGQVVDSLYTTVKRRLIDDLLTEAGRV